MDDYIEEKGRKREGRGGESEGGERERVSESGNGVGKGSERGGWGGGIAHCTTLPPTRLDSPQGAIFLPLPHSPLRVFLILLSFFLYLFHSTCSPFSVFPPPHSPFSLLPFFLHIPSSLQSHLSLIIHSSSYFSHSLSLFIHLLPFSFFHSLPSLSLILHPFNYYLYSFLSPPLLFSILLSSIISFPYPPSPLPSSSSSYTLLGILF